VVGQQNADIADTVQLQDVAMATIFGFPYMAAHWHRLANQLNHQCVAAMQPYVT